jgi:hypothetical protein
MSKDRKPKKDEPHRDLVTKDELSDEELDAANGGLFLISNVVILIGLMVPR